jgi:hypothetical protein
METDTQLLLECNHSSQTLEYGVKLISTVWEDLRAVVSLCSFVRKRQIDVKIPAEKSSRVRVQRLDIVIHEARIAEARPERRR